MPPRAKQFNDPVHGFIEVPQGLLLTLVDHPYFQRLRRIRQGGATVYVYAGATHTRYSHGLGAFFLAGQALDVLQKKGVSISAAEKEATLVAILLHDLGHGPFSHALEPVLLPGISHEELSRRLMQLLNEELNGALELALHIFDGSYHRPFLHALVASQLDMDRLDYLVRDSFFTGVSEGIVGVDRIIKTLHVVDDKLVVEHKGIYSIEKFIVARRLMYWQVYLHKTSLVAEQMLISLMGRVRQLWMAANKSLWMNEALGYLLKQPALSVKDLTAELLQHFIALDDHDIYYALKQWRLAEDPVVADLSARLLDRRLLKLQFQSAPVDQQQLQQLRLAWQERSGIAAAYVPYYVLAGSISNLAYLKKSEEPILVLRKDGEVVDLLTASDVSTLGGFTQVVTKHYLIQPQH